MIFEFADKIREINIGKLNSINNTVAYVSASEFSKFYKNFGFTSEAFIDFEREDKYFRSKIEVHHNYSYGTLRIIEPQVHNRSENHIAFCITKKLTLIIGITDHEHSVQQKFLETVNRSDSTDFSNEKFISSFIDSLINCDNKGLEEIEFQINNMEDRILKEKEYKNFNEEVLSYKRKLLSLRNYYEQLIDIGESLTENENNIFDENNLSYFLIFIRKAERLASNVSILRDNITQLRETYQSALDLKLNNTMKLFTVLTAFFSPLTLIAGWYGMNFRYMPELNWKYGYLYVILLSVSALITCIIIFKRKKLI